MQPLIPLADDAPRRRSKRKKPKQAKKPTTREALVRLRAEEAEREAWISCAAAEGFFSLSDWIRELANNRARQRPMLASGSMDWNTPPEVLHYVRELFGTIGLDPCSNASSLVEARTEWDSAADGLERSWIGKGSAFVNPPYGEALPRWIQKCRAEAVEGVEILALVPARTETAWFRAMLDSPAVIGFWRGRIQFAGAPHPATFPSVIVYWGPRSDNFVEVFAELCNGFIRGT